MYVRYLLLCCMDWSCLLTPGLKTALVEQFDYSSGTSSRSTKLIHGGVRYLQKALLGLDIEQVTDPTQSNHKSLSSFTVYMHVAMCNKLKGHCGQIVQLAYIYYEIAHLLGWIIGTEVHVLECCCLSLATHCSVDQSKCNALTSTMTWMAALAQARSVRLWSRNYWRLIL